MVDYRVWTDDTGASVGVTVNFKAGDDFRYELLAADWRRFLTEVLSVTDTAAAAPVFRSFLARKDGMSAFEKALKQHGIDFKKSAAS